jgi:hypothetical protein
LDLPWKNRDDIPDCVNEIAQDLHEQKEMFRMLMEKLQL